VESLYVFFTLAINILGIFACVLIYFQGDDI